MAVRKTTRKPTSKAGDTPIQSAPVKQASQASQASQADSKVEQLAADTHTLMDMKARAIQAAVSQGVTTQAAYLNRQLADALNTALTILARQSETLQAGKL